MSHQAEKFYQSCPYCQARYLYLSELIGSDDSVACQNCGRLMSVSGESLEALPIEDVIAQPIFTRRFLYGFAITVLLIFIIILFLHSTLDLESTWWPPWVIIPVEPP